MQGRAESWQIRCDLPPGSGDPRIPPGVQVLIGGLILGAILGVLLARAGATRTVVALAVLLAVLTALVASFLAWRRAKSLLHLLPDRVRVEPSASPAASGRPAREMQYRSVRRLWHRDAAFALYDEERRVVSFRVARFCEEDVLDDLRDRIESVNPDCTFDTLNE